VKIGVLGGGQLGRMLALAGHPLGVGVRCYDASEEAPAGQVTELHVGRFEDLSALARFAEGLDAVTYEFENVPVGAAEFLAGRLAVLPGVRALAASQDRCAERALFEGLGVPTPRSIAAASAEEAREAAAELGWRAVIKTRRLGYDGKGQAVVSSEEEFEGAWRRVSGGAGRTGGGWLVDELVEFEREVSIVAARGRGGETRFYPLVENVHRGGILRESRAPAAGSGALQALAEGHAALVMGELGYVGVMALEFFQVRRGGEAVLLANEMAPRVHNSGHWTIEGAECSQFENHLRAVAGWPLGATGMRCGCVAAMVNLIGTVPEMGRCLGVEGAHVHLYGKAARPGRKVGHITVCAPGREAVEARLREVSAAAGAGA
jgi:5-(carboxyamino)imidazole ribonucleotide synthase